MATLNTASAIISESLNFLGLGIKLPTASWGSILRSGRDCLNGAPYRRYLRLLYLLTVIGFNLLGRRYTRCAGSPKDEVAMRKIEKTGRDVYRPMFEELTELADTI